MNQMGEIYSITASIDEQNSCMSFEKKKYTLYYSFDTDVKVFAQIQYGEQISKAMNVRMPAPYGNILYPFPTIWMEGTKESLADAWKNTRMKNTTLNKFIDLNTPSDDTKNIQSDIDEESSIDGFTDNELDMEDTQSSAESSESDFEDK